MVQSARRLRSIESLEEQFIELDRRMAIEAGAKTPRPPLVDLPKKVDPPASTAPLRAVEDTGNSPYVRLAAHTRPGPQRLRRD